METITLKVRTTKETGTVKLRFRLRDGRDIELYHKSDIETKISDLDKLTIEGKKKKEKVAHEETYPLAEINSVTPYIDFK